MISILLAASALAAPAASPPAVPAKAGVKTAVAIPPATSPTTRATTSPLPPKPAVTGTLQKGTAARPAIVHVARTRATHVARHRPSSLGHVASANAAATREPAPAGFINAVQVYPYAEGMLYRLYAAPERISDVVLQPGEALVAVASGDTVRWTIGDTTSGSGETRRTHILVKPFSAGLTTNVVITTDRRTYHLALASSAGASMAALSWSYPQDALLAIKSVAAPAPTTSIIEKSTSPTPTLAVERLRFDYAISGDRTPWRPLRAFDDGRQTFIEFPAGVSVGQAPPLFLVDTKGAAALVNYRMQGRFYVVDRLFDTAELRLGGKHQQVVRITREGGARQGRGA